ncbi:Putative UbiD-like carboxylase (modular protein) [uncultured Desulfatiglans sp.]|uniref:UbiD-like carboxylase (Modular protein) n=1 Tax=Uncultured Desulfatiglans sp. TaxID=1748965 RepID=A0A653AB25_UNCDX|nr:Putative UbiD-like carboxylase (modular protein) [uncultured Desulfatiglans sp.]
MINDMRDFLELLDGRGELVRVSKPVEDGHEIFNVLWHLSELGGGPAVVFENVMGGDIPVVGNLFGTLDRFAMACGFEPGQSIDKYRDLFLEKLDPAGWKKPVEVSVGACQEVVLTGDEVDLGKLPIMQWHPDDGGPYITMPLVIAEDPKWGVNTSIYRMMVHNRNETGLMCNIFQDQGKYLANARKRGLEEMPCAVAIGLDPAVYAAAVTKIPLQASELDFASALRGGRPLEMVKAKTIDLMVPAQAEIVLEGHVSTIETRPEGPYGEWMGFFEEEMVLPVFKVKAITHRKDPLFLTTIEGPEMGDAEIVRMIPQIASFSQQAKSRVSGLVDAWVPPSSRNYMAVLSIKKYHPGWGKTAVYQAFGIPFVAASVNFVVIVDDDIDVRDPDQIIWALSTRVDPVHDVIIAPPTGGYVLNPAASQRERQFAETKATDIVMVSKIGIDATIKTPAEGRERPAARVVRPRREMYERVLDQWKNYGFEK